jgi:hypothetical protein
MKTRQSAIAAAVLLGLTLVVMAPDSCVAGRYTSSAGYSTSSGYSTSAYRPASPVYGFGPTGRSFTYQPSGSAPYSAPVRSPVQYGPHYRFDAFTRPPASTGYTTPLSSQQYYFSGRMWYPRQN